MNNNRLAQIFLVALIVVIVCAPALRAENGVLQSGQENSETKSDYSSPSPSNQSNFPQATIKLKFRPRPSQAEQATPPALENAQEASDSSSDVNSIFKSTNPHLAAGLRGTSPFVQQVGAIATPYRKQPVINHGKVKQGVSRAAVIRRAQPAAVSDSPQSQPSS